MSDEGRLQIIYSGVTHVDMLVESLDMETNPAGSITLKAKGASASVRRPQLRVVLGDAS